MDDYSSLREQIGQDLDTLHRTENPKSIFEIADDYLLGNPNLKRAIVEDIIKEEADKRGIAIHWRRASHARLCTQKGGIPTGCRPFIFGGVASSALRHPRPDPA